MKWNLCILIDRLKRLWRRKHYQEGNGRYLEGVSHRVGQGIRLQI